MLAKSARLGGVVSVIGLLVASLTTPAAAGPPTSSDRLQHELQMHGDGAPLMIAAHRGQWRKAAENSLAGIDAAMRDGADIVEVDIQRTKDGQLVLMHDGTVDRTTNGTGRVSDLTLAQLKSLRLRKGLGGTQAPLTAYTVPTLNEAMRLVKGRAFVNLDKGWPFREQVYDVLAATGTVGQGLFKGSPTKDDAVAFMAGHPAAQYIHMVDDNNAADIGTFPGRQPVAYEVIFDNVNDRQVQPAAIATMKRTSRVWINTMWKGLAAQMTDEASLRDETLGWKTVVSRFGASMIQTDNTEALNYWRGGGDLSRWQSRGPGATVRVQAEDYAPGGEGVGFHDLDANRCTVMRPGEGVDVCDTEGAVAVNWIRAGEWIKYSLVVKQTGRYRVIGRVSSPYAPAGTVRLDWDGKPGASVSITNTTAHSAFEQQRFEERFLTAGKHEVVLRMDQNSYQNFNLDYLQLDLLAPAAQPLPITTGTAMIDTPYGPQPSSDVIAVAPGETVRSSAGRLWKVDSRTGRTLADLGAASPAKERAATEASAGLGGACPSAAATNIKSFSTTWTVPSKPLEQDPRKTYFVWNGLSRGALQPVLGWGNNVAGYRLANWAYIGGKYVHGNFAAVDPGDQVTGLITFTGRTSAGWNYTVSVVGRPGLDLKVTRTGEAKDVIQCFEDVTNGGPIPPDRLVRMHSIKLTTNSGAPPATLRWVGRGGSQATVVTDNSSSHGEVDLYFHGI
ncbi:glycerophosphodiester phosphodiesterase family protein [Kribbella sp. NPDC051587]|uniref:glycerophosphodiester phosphodiesterase family protein n=1 Tax=Kribbella sp. NPDC051587 TaxID=3364119 RepID=UPI0037BA3E94